MAPEAPLGTMLDTSLKKTWFLTPKKSLRGAQKPPGDPKLEWNLRWISTLFASFFWCYFSTNFELIFRGSEPEKCGSRLGETLFFVKLTFSKKVLKITNFGTHFGEKKREKSINKLTYQFNYMFSLFFAIFSNFYWFLRTRWSIIKNHGGVRRPPPGYS